MNTQIKTNSAVTGLRDIKGLSNTGLPVNNMVETPHASNTPEKKFRAGAITATVWANKIQNKTGEEGEYHTISLERNYTDKDGKWHSTNSMRVNDLPRALIVLQKAYEYSVLQEQ
ncbi:hypothetical protein HYV86_05845 [Candidatus Woesearchaeota archaeon]|nr:hypothetical protein [Candidatus Woesearchaeota archaeon]